MRSRDRCVGNALIAVVVEGKRLFRWNGSLKFYCETFVSFMLKNASNAKKLMKRFDKNRDHSYEKKKTKMDDRF